jgi:hypothetical protein
MISQLGINKQKNIKSFLEGLANLEGQILIQMGKMASAIAPVFWKHP